METSTKRLRTWWIVIAVTLAIVITLWSIVIFYLLTPHPVTLVNHQIYARPNQTGQTDDNLFLVKEAPPPPAAKRRNLIDKASSVSLYDLQRRTWLPASYYLIPSYKKNRYYLLKPDSMIQAEYDSTNQQFRDSKLAFPKARPFYFFRELAVLLGFCPSVTFPFHVI